MKWSQATGESLRAALAGIAEIPCIIRNLTDDEATIVMVDSNLQREKFYHPKKHLPIK